MPIDIGSNVEDELRQELAKIKDENTTLRITHDILMYKDQVEMDLEMSEDDSIEKDDVKMEVQEIDLSNDELQEKLESILRKQPQNRWEKVEYGEYIDVESTSNNVDDNDNGDNKKIIKEEKLERIKTEVDSSWNSTEAGSSSTIRDNQESRLCLKINGDGIKGQKVEVLYFSVKSFKTIGQIKKAYSKRLHLTSKIRFFILPTLEEIEDNTIVRDLGNCEICASSEVVKRKTKPMVCFKLVIMENFKVVEGEIQGNKMKTIKVHVKSSKTVEKIKHSYSKILNLPFETKLFLLPNLQELGDDTMTRDLDGCVIVASIAK